MQEFIKVCEDFGEEECEVPLEDDGTLLLTTLQSIFPGVTGLKFRNPSTFSNRAVKIDSNFRFHSPGISSSDGWDCENIIYICVFPKPLVEAKAEEVAEVPEKVTKPADEPQGASGAQPKTVDLIILNLSTTTTEAELRSYFESKFGPLIMTEIKRDRRTGASRRFAFIRFQGYKDQMRALGMVKHKIDGQQVRVGLPDYRDPSELYLENKCFIGRVNENIKANDLKEFFAQFGEIIEISYPKKFKGYAFVTFADADIARGMCGQDFVIKGYSVCVSKSTNGSSNNKQPMPNAPMTQNMNQRYGGGGGGYQNDWSNGWYSNDSYGGQKPYVTVPLNPQVGASRNNSNFYGHSSALASMGNSMLSSNSMNMLSMAMGNLLTNSMGSQNYRDRTHTNGTLWSPRNDTAKPKKKQKKSKNAKNKSKDAGDEKAEANGDAESPERKEDARETPVDEVVVDSVEIIS